MTELETAYPTLHLVGRNGMHRYNNQDHAMMTAMLTVRNIQAGRRAYDIWAVNEDAEYHELGDEGAQAALASERLVPNRLKGGLSAMLDQMYTRYIGASVASLGVDFAIFMAMLSLGLTPALAAACGYIAGIACHWVISSRMVFVGQVATVGAARRQQQALFLLSALVGPRDHHRHCRPRQPLRPRSQDRQGHRDRRSFQATYVLRKKVVFA